jgi:WD40 repeat protein
MSVSRQLVIWCCLLCGWIELASGEEQAGKEPSNRVDAYGDPLPPRAICRLGTTRLLHTSSVTGAAFSPDGRLFASASNEDRVIVWEWPSGKRLQTFLFRSRDLPLVQFSQNSSHLNAYGDKKFVVWDVAAGQVVLRATTTCSPALSAQGKRVAWLEDHTIFIGELAAGKEPVAQSRPGQLLAMGYDRDDTLLIAEHTGKRLYLTNQGTGKRIYESDIGVEPPLWTQFSSDSSCFAFQTKHSGITVIRVQTGKEQYHIAALTEAFFPLALDNAAKTLPVRAGGDRPFQVWDLEGGRQLCTLDKYSFDGRFHCGAFAPDGKLLAVGGINGAHGATFWETRSGKPVESFAGNRDRINSIAFSPDGKELAACGGGRGDPMVRIWDPTNGRLLRSFAAHRPGVDQVLYSPDGTRLFTCGWTTGEVRSWDAQKLSELPTFKASHRGVGYLAISPNGELLASICTDTTPTDVAIWDLKTGQKLYAHPDLSSVRGAVFIQGGHTLATCGYDKVRLWQVGAAPEGSYVDIEGGTLPSAFSPDGRVVVVTGFVNEASWLAEVVTGKRICAVAEGLKVVRAAFAPDGRTIALGIDDGMIRLLDWPTGKEVLSFQAHSAGVSALSFAPDCKRLASVGSRTDCGVVLVWDVADVMHRLLKEVPAKPNEIENWCTALSAVDAETAYLAVWSLAAAPEQSLPRLKVLLAKLVVPEQKQIVGWIADLDNNRFKVREDAEKQQLKAGAWAKQEVDRALTKAPSPEQRRRLLRVQQTLSTIGVAPERIFLTRALLAIEQIGGRRAFEVLRELEREPSAAIVREQARQVANRLSRIGVR